MQSNISTLCAGSNSPNALAIVYYDKADTTKAPTSAPWNVPDPGTCENDDFSLTVPYYSIAAATPSTTQTMVIDLIQNSTGSFLWRLDGTSFRGDYNDPILLLAAKGNLSFPTEWNIKNFGTNNTVRVVINNQSPTCHPMHIHGHTIQVLSQGAGDYDGSSIVNANNPQCRDTQLVPASGHFAFQFTTDNPGVWPFHCHIAWHVCGGLYATFMEQPASIVATTQVPLVLQEMCTNWAAYTAKDVVD